MKIGVENLETAKPWSVRGKKKKKEKKRGGGGGGGGGEGKFLS